MEEHFVWMTTRHIKPGTLADFERAWRPGTHPEGMLRAYAYWSADEREIVGVSFWVSQAAWAVASPQQVLAARVRAVDRMFRALLGDLIGSPGLAEAAELARVAALAAGTAGRTLAAANADLPWPGEPHLVLWHAINVLREHRGDGHIAALLVAGLDPCEALVSFAAIGAAPGETFASRGWSAREWLAARDRLAARGWVDAAGKATERGRDGRDEIEWRTDRLADAPWRALGSAARSGSPS